MIGGYWVNPGPRSIGRLWPILMKNSKFWADWNFDPIRELLHQS